MTNFRKTPGSKCVRWMGALLLSATTCSFTLAKVPTSQPDSANSPVAERLYPEGRSAFLPEHSTRGPHSVGVRTIKLVNPQQLNLTTQQLQDRALTIELWHPAPAHQNSSQYDNVTRLGKPFSVHANAERNASLLSPKDSDSRYPLVILSHGYTGYRTLMFYLAEHLASHGYLVAGIDHTDSTNANVTPDKAYAGFPSTLYHRSRDQLFVRDQLLNQNDFVASAVDKNSVGLVGYSMGGYGLMASIGGCYDFSLAALRQMNPNGTDEEHLKAQQLLNNCQQPSTGNLWQGAIAMAPWGNQLGIFPADRLESITTPTLTISGELDDVSIHSSIVQMHQQLGSQDKYLLTYKNARHNIAPHPAPLIAYQHEYDLGHYFEPAWSNQQINLINQHFALAMMDCHLKQKSSACDYLQLEGEVESGWKGFPQRFATGLSWQR